VPGSVFAISDLHSSYAANRLIVDELRTECGDDWLIVAGDEGETFGDIVKTLRLLRQRYAKDLDARQPRAVDAARRSNPTPR
jgi:hypothetical protein